MARGRSLSITRLARRPGWSWHRRLKYKMTGAFRSFCILIYSHNAQRKPDFYVLRKKHRAREIETDFFEPGRTFKIKSNLYPMKNRFDDFLKLHHQSEPLLIGNA